MKLGCSADHSEFCSGTPAARNPSARIDETATLEVRHKQRLTSLAKELKTKKEVARELPEDSGGGNPMAELPRMNHPRGNFARES